MPSAGHACAAARPWRARSGWRRDGTHYRPELIPAAPKGSHVADRRRRSSRDRASAQTPGVARATRCQSPKTKRYLDCGAFRRPPAGICPQTGSLAPPSSVRWIATALIDYHRVVDKLRADPSSPSKAAVCSSDRSRCMTPAHGVLTFPAESAPLKRPRRLISCNCA